MLKGPSKFQWIRQIYLYLVAIISVVIFLISSIGLITLVLNEFVFNVQDYEQIASQNPYECQFQTNGKPVSPEFGNIDDTSLSKEEVEKNTAECIKLAQERAELNHTNNVKRDIVTYLAMLLVAIPVYLFHWRIIKKEARK